MIDYIPYTYRLKCPNGLFYYGVKYANNKRDVANPDTFWVSYFTSSSNIKKLIDQYGVDSFTFEIRKTFKDAKSAIEWESKVNKRYTTKSPKYLNDSYIDGRNQSGCNNGNYGKIMSKASKEKAKLTRLINNGGQYKTKKNIDYSYITDEWKLENKERQIRVTKESRLSGKMDELTSITYKDSLKIIELWKSFQFPSDPSAYKTRGSKLTDISYFAEYIIKNNLVLIKEDTKHPKMAIKNIIRKFKNADKK